VKGTTQILYPILPLRA